MPIIDITKYYYFKIKNGSPYQIKESVIRINTNINKNYVELTSEQKAFYDEHPTASVMEVWNCELIPPYVPPVPDVAEYASKKIKEIKSKCYDTISITTLEYAMAIDKCENVTADSYYSLSDAREVISNFRSQSKGVMTIFDTYKDLIEKASTIDAIDTLYGQAIESLDNFNLL